MVNNMIVINFYFRGEKSLRSLQTAGYLVLSLPYFEYSDETLHPLHISVCHNALFVMSSLEFLLLEIIFQVVSCFG